MTLPDSSEQLFTVAVLGDSQAYVLNESNAEVFSAQVRWLVENARGLNLKLVTSVGDIVDSPEDAEQWQRADRAMSQLDCTEVAWSAAFGNHDDAREAGPGMYLDHFGPSRHQRRSWFGGASPNGLSAFQIFRAAGRRFLHLSLEYDAPDDALRWAGELLSSPEHRELPTLLTTHVWLNDNRGSRYFESSTTVVKRLTQANIEAPSRNSAEQIWQKLVRKHPQVFLVFCGHLCGERLLVTDNDAGRPVYQLQVDYSRRLNGGDGWLKLLTFDLGSQQLRVQTYSPTRDEYQRVDPDLPEGNELVEYREGGTFADGHAEFVLPLRGSLSE